MYNLKFTVRSFDLAKREVKFVVSDEGGVIVTVKLPSNVIKALKDRHEKGEDLPGYTLELPT
jgi:hypothetical protein